MTLTDKKITTHSLNRRNYYAPTENGYECPYLKKDVNGETLIVTDETNNEFTRRLCCTELAPYCSYHLADLVTQVVDKADPTKNVQHYICHRYVMWQNAKEALPTDTHNRELKINGRRLDWF